ncbi:MAG: hypothetical protein KAU28_06565 [Phycisphaerae bacterium]|nr:hypothetical protein [Phycisphaerae bacterium]
MKHITTGLLCLAAMAVFASPLSAEAVDKEGRTDEELILSRLARADAVDRLAGQIEDLEIASETTVRDFLAETKGGRTALIVFLCTVGETAKPCLNKDGEYVVAIEIPMRDVIAHLKWVHERYYEGEEIKAEDFAAMAAGDGKTVLAQEGVGEPWRQQSAPGGAASEVGTEPYESETYPAGAARKFWEAHCKRRGRLLAVRAARVDAMRRLTVQVARTVIAGEVTAKDLLDDSGDADISFEIFLLGARETAVRYHERELIVEVEMQVKLRTFLASLKSWAHGNYRGEKVTREQFEQLLVGADGGVITAVGIGMPPAACIVGLDEGARAVMAAAKSPPLWIGRKLRAAGSGATEAAAELDARIKLTEKINKLKIEPGRSVGDLAAASEEIRRAVLAFVQGAGVAEGSKKPAEDGMVEVTTEIELRGLWNTILFYKRELAAEAK